MASTYLTPTMVTRAAAAILHAGGKILPRINRQYDAQTYEGRKTGGTLKIRMPNEYTVRTGATMSTQDISETSEALAIATIKGVDLNFSDTDLALSIEDFSKRILAPAIKVLVSNIEKDIVGGFADFVSNMVDDDGNAISFLDVMKAKQKLIENLAPEDDEEDLTLLMSPNHNTKLVDALKGLFTPSKQLGEQFTTGNLLPIAGVGYAGVSTHLTDHTTGTAVRGNTGYVTNISSWSDGATIAVDGGTTTFNAGDIIEIGGVNAVHPETKADLGYRKQFSVATTTGTSATSLVIQPVSGGDAGIVSSGARQNVSAAPADEAVIYKDGPTNGGSQNRTIYFHRDALAVCFADLENPSKYGAWGDVQKADMVSVRVWRQGDITNGKFPARLDVLYGYRVIRPQLACKIHANG